MKSLRQPEKTHFNGVNMTKSANMNYY